MLLQTGVLQAQVSNSASSLLLPLDNTGGSARAAAMGSAFVAVADDSSAILWNPAGLGELRQGQIGLYHNSWLVNTDQESLAAGLPMGDLGGIGAMVSYMDYGTFPGRDAVGNITPDYTVDRMGFMLGWGKEWTPGFSTGLALQGGVQSALGYSYSVWSGDVGLLYQFDPHMRFGAALVDFGGDLSGDWAAAALRFGVSYDPKWVGPHRLLVDFDGTVEFQGVNRVGVGAEYSYQSKYFLRAGYEFHEQDDLIPGLQDLTAGAGIRFDDLELDYAYLPYGELGTSQQISLSYFFPSSPPHPTPAMAVKKPVSDAVETPAGFKPEPGSGTDKKPLTLLFDVPPDLVAQGQSLEGQGNTTEAVQTYQAEITKNPDEVSAWSALGTCYFKMGQKVEAIKCFEQVLKLRPDAQALADWLEKYKAQN
jgi:hypothetical protein